MTAPARPGLVVALARGDRPDEDGALPDDAPHAASPPPSGAPRPTQAEQVRPLRCPYCLDALGLGGPGARPLACPACRAPMHPACVVEASACAACGSPALQAAALGAFDLEGWSRVPLDGAPVERAAFLRLERAPLPPGARGLALRLDVPSRRLALGPGVALDAADHATDQAGSWVAATVEVTLARPTWLGALRLELTVDADDARPGLAALLGLGPRPLVRVSLPLLGPRPDATRGRPAPARWAAGRYRAHARVPLDPRATATLDAARARLVVALDRPWRRPLTAAIALSTGP